MQDAVQQQIIDEFAIFDDWLDRYDYIIGLADELPPIDPAHRTEKYVIEGCQSRVWIDARLEKSGDAGEADEDGERGDAGEAGRVFFSADSDAIITKGIVALLVRVLNGRTPQEILDTELYFIDRIGLRENLSPTRSNGVLAMIRQMKAWAMVFKNEIPRRSAASLGMTEEGGLLGMTEGDKK